MTQEMRRQLSLSEQGNVLVVCGDVDFGNVGGFEQVLTRLRGTYETVVADLAGVTYMDSSGFAVLLRTSRELRHRGGQLVLRRPAGHVRRMLEITHMLRFFVVEEAPMASEESVPA